MYGSVKPAEKKNLLCCQRRRNCRYEFKNQRFDTTVTSLFMNLGTFSYNVTEMSLQCMDILAQKQRKFLIRRTWSWTKMHSFMSLLKNKSSVKVTTVKKKIYESPEDDQGTI